MQQLARGLLRLACSLPLPGWIKFHQASTPTAASLVTCCMGVALIWNLYTHRKWGAYLLQDEAEQQVLGSVETDWPLRD
jgi:hypothetical protein